MCTFSFIQFIFILIIGKGDLSLKVFVENTKKSKLKI